MTTKTFGTEYATSDEHIAALYEAAGVEFPIKVQVEAGKILAAEYSTEFKVGSTTPIETVNDDGETVIEYEENYEIVKLAKTQQDAIDAYIQANLKE